VDELKKENNIVVFQDGEIELKVSIEKESIWLKAEDIATLFEVNRPAIVKHIGNIYKTDELEENLTCSILEQVAKDGKKRKIKFYNLDMIISVGYRVNSKRATNFRRWATQVLKQYIYNGYAINAQKITVDRFLNLEKDVRSIKQEIKELKEDKKQIQLTQGIFYDGQIWDAYEFINTLLKNAKKEVVLIDNYIDDTVLTLFSKYPKLNYTIITKSISKQLKLDIEKYNLQYKNLTIKTSNKYHDRFLLLDDEAYHLGASLKDLGKKVFGFSKIDRGLLKV
jgi:prophage antirepressor-like protein